MGEEVIVDFLEGDPDQPIIIGRVYNASDAPPEAAAVSATTRRGALGRALLGLGGLVGLGAAGEASAAQPRDARALRARRRRRHSGGRAGAVPMRGDRLTLRGELRHRPDGRAAR